MFMLSWFMGMGNDVLMFVASGIYEMFMVGNGVMFMLSRFMGMGNNTLMFMLNRYSGSGCIALCGRMFFFMDGDAGIQASLQ